MIQEKAIEAMLETALAASGARALSSWQRQKLLAFLAEIARWGDRVHLVGRGSFKKNIGTQLLDSLLMLGAAEKRIPRLAESAGLKAADLGSGAGFPGIVWKIARPHLDISLFERRLKLHAFLERAISLLAMPGIRARGEDASICPDAGAFDLVVSKASGRLPEIAPVAERLLGNGGTYVTIKGRAWECELAEIGGDALKYLGADRLARNRGFALYFEKNG